MLPESSSRRDSPPLNRKNRWSQASQRYARKPNGFKTARSNSTRICDRRSAFEWHAGHTLFSAGSAFFPRLTPNVGAFPLCVCSITVLRFRAIPFLILDNS
jgi:hypothetical protein